MRLRKPGRAPASPPAPPQPRLPDAPPKPPWEQFLDPQERPNRETLASDHNVFADTLLEPVPLPKWLRFDTRQRAFSGIVPAGVSEELTIMAEQGGGGLLEALFVRNREGAQTHSRQHAAHLRDRVRVGFDNQGQTPRAHRLFAIVALRICAVGMRSHRPSAQ